MTGQWLMVGLREDIGVEESTPQLLVFEMESTSVGIDFRQIYARSFTAPPESALLVTLASSFAKHDLARDLQSELFFVVGLRDGRVFYSSFAHNVMGELGLWEWQEAALGMREPVQLRTVSLATPRGLHGKQTRPNLRLSSKGILVQGETCWFLHREGRGIVTCTQVDMGCRGTGWAPITPPPAATGEDGVIDQIDASRVQFLAWTSNFLRLVTMNLENKVLVNNPSHLLQLIYRYIYLTTTFSSLLLVVERYVLNIILYC